jgi:hypothetical protein
MAAVRHEAPNRRLQGHDFVSIAVHQSLFPPIRGYSATSRPSYRLHYHISQMVSKTAGSMSGFNYI